LENASFETIRSDQVPGWQVAALVNWQPGEDFSPDFSYGQPDFGYADDSRRVISGTTLMISTYQWVKFSVTLYQTVELEPGSEIQFEIMARGYADNGGIQLRAGIDPDGGAACQDGLWSDTVVRDQFGGIALLQAPEAVVGEEGRVTVCFFSEPQYAAAHSAAFFDEALLSVLPPAEWTG
jgi:hypothetical protein